ncbi:MAG: GH3 auxin-responsive promoter family protein [Synergistaceae bacterium]|nr:GH3 auxin-responsive promoter family protein [Synergistaceae bacterium]MBQ6910261.1 GH3 auxin-responsive promoter family protein [Synergistaceae bacterium]MBQ7569346.1 GH3 auxin-responsive promoter family protein [Synergistaceae bacterium]MBQ9581097.1 GH3 auxin-responsive promoter family protein [Synergistaceae bacterium]MBQ9896483.1 GH3 auxin-responsive promoter family protein [Synergistaceae bacterium]
MSDSKDTEYVRKYNFAGIKSVEDFKRMVPFTTYDDYEPYITRMIENGEKNLLTANPNDKETNFLIVVLKNYYIYSFIDY